MKTRARGVQRSLQNHHSSSYIFLLLLFVYGPGDAAQVPLGGLVTPSISLSGVPGVEVYRVLVPGMNIFVIGRSVLHTGVGSPVVVPPPIGSRVMPPTATLAQAEANDAPAINTPAHPATTTTTSTAAPTTTTTTAAPTTTTTTAAPTTTTTTTPPTPPDPANKGNTTSISSGWGRRSPNKRRLARLMKQQFDRFKDSLAAPTEAPTPQLKEGVAAQSSAKVAKGRGRSLRVGEAPIKAERRAGEDPSGVHSGLLQLDHHPIPVTFTSLPGFPSRLPAPPSTPPRTPSQTATLPGSSGAVTPLSGDQQFGAVGRPSAGRRTPVQNSQVSDLMRLLESRLIGGLRAATPGTSPAPGYPPHQHFDPSIVVNFLTLVALSQQRSSGVRSSVQRNASPSSFTLSTAPNTASGGGEFGPFSTGDDPSAGVDPSTIALPPMLRQSLYSYLLPRLASLSALVETVPGVPGLDYPIIAAVPYTNFYCSEMPWPGFYADTEARCQAWHYCDLDGRQASFLCPNGTMFNQAFFVCDWWYNVDCQSAPYLYSLNERVFDLPEVDETAPHRTLTAEILDTIFV